jgi:hypothetical protein
MRGAEVKPFRAIDLWKFLKLPRLRRPLHPEIGALNRRRVDIAIHCPDGNDFPTGLAHRYQRNSVAMNFKTCFFVKFPLGRLQRIGTFVIFALRNRPRSIILLGPERAARMNQQYLNGVASYPIEQDPGAQFDSHALAYAERGHNSSRKIRSKTADLMQPPGQAVNELASDAFANAN